MNFANEIKQAPNANRILEILKQFHQTVKILNLLQLEYHVQYRQTRFEKNPGRPVLLTQVKHYILSIIE